LLVCRLILYQPANLPNDISVPNFLITNFA
jgi:hypothetical protein